VAAIRDGSESKDLPLINNRQAGRRNRGRNNGRPNGSNRGGGDNGNRIDNRARGNAAQLLEKYRNMARDAQLAGDRVNAEYYLQFADHYFRVLADNRARQEEQQARHRRNEDGFEDDADEFENGAEGENDFGGDFDDRPFFQPQQREQSQRDQSQRDGNRQPRDEERGDRNRGRNRRDRDDRRPPLNQPAQAEAAPAPEPVVAAAPQAAPAPVVEEAAEAAPAPRRRGRPPRKPVVEDTGEASAFDPAILPPAIARADNDADGQEEAAPRKRTRRPRAAAEAAE
jgi:hypothetical protein